MQSLNSPLNSGCLEFKRVKVAEKNIFELSSFINEILDLGALINNPTKQG